MGKNFLKSIPSFHNQVIQTSHFWLKNALWWLASESVRLNRLSDITSFRHLMINTKYDLNFFNILRHYGLLSSIFKEYS